MSRRGSPNGQPPDPLRASLVASVGPYQLAQLDVASLRGSLLAMPADERASLLLERLRTYADGTEFAYWSDFPAASFVIDVTDDAKVATLAYRMIHLRLTARRRRATGDALKGEDVPYYGALLRAGGPRCTPHVTAMLTWYSDDASIAGAVLDALRGFGDPDAVVALEWVARFDKANRERAVALLAALGDGVLGVVETLSASDEGAAREVAFRALAAMHTSRAARRLAARIRARAKGVPRATRDAVVAMAEAATPGEGPDPPPFPMEVLPKRVPPRLPDAPDASRVEDDRRAIEDEADAVPEGLRAALDAALDAPTPDAIDAAVDAIGAPAMPLALRWHRAQRTDQLALIADRVARVAARVPVTPGTAAAAVPWIAADTGLLFRDEVTALVGRFAEHLLAPAAYALAPGRWASNRPALVAALAQHHPRAALRLLLDGLPEFRSWDAVSRALEAIGADAIEGCAALLTAKDVPTARAAARHLTRIADPAALPVIEYYLPRTKPGVHDELTRALEATLRASSARSG